MQTILLDKSNQKITTSNHTICNINSKDLLDIPIILPSVQRIRDDDKVKDIVLYQQNELKNKGFCNFLGVINIHFCKETEQFYLVDGQHRFEAIKIINKTNNIPVLVEYIEVTTISELKINYQLINMNTPLPEFSENIDKNIPEQVAIFFREQYPEIWSKSPRARRPHIYFNYFQEALGIITEKLNIASSIELQQIILDHNKKLSKWDHSLFPDGKSINDNMKQKCITIGLYLGYYKHISDDYGYEWVNDIIKQYTGENMKKNNVKQISISKSNISKSLKTALWDQYIGKNIRSAQCICCNNNEIKVENFHAGHIIPECIGGETNQNNLLPICASCNNSMGTKNMTDFVQNCFPNHYSNFIERKYKIHDNKKQKIGLFKRLGL